MTRRVIELVEYTPRLLARDELTAAEGEALWRDYDRLVEVEFPSPVTDGRWRLTAGGYAGFLPLSESLGFALRPRVETGNLFRMLELAYKLDLRTFGGSFDTASLEEFYERLANVLAKRVLERLRQGLYKSYVARARRLPYVAGRVDVARLAREPWRADPYCRYQEHTADVEDNQLLGWTLGTISRSGLCTERVLPTVRRAYRELQGRVGSRPFTPADCHGRMYSRLNEDYGPMHALCRFFLEHTGPAHQLGDTKMVPFVVRTPRLFELFVAEWLKANLAPPWRVRAQERFSVGPRMTFAIDLVLHGGGGARCVMDTKYKPAGRPATGDVFQAVAYAEAQGCRDAVLIYPGPLSEPFDERVGRTRVRGLTFSVSGNLDEAGRHFLRDLLGG